VEFEAYVTRQMTLADETLCIAIQGDMNFESFKARILQACECGDYRVHQEVHRLIEDTSLLESMNPEEICAAYTTLTILYPQMKFLPELLKKGVKFEIGKLNAGGESIKVRVQEIKQNDNVFDILVGLWDLIDTRLNETNHRELAYMEHLKTVDYDTRLKVIMLLDTLYGRQTPEYLKSRLAQELVTNDL